MNLPTLPSFRLDNKTALVTGAGRGIGLAAAVALAQSGAKVTLVARSGTEVSVASVAIKQAGGDAYPLVLDVTDPVRVDEAVEHGGPFDILVNCAGMNRPKDLLTIANEDLDDIFDLNVKAAFYTSRAVAKSLLRLGKTGSFINISSQMGHVGSPNRAIYCASKHAVEGMTKALAWELGGRGIRVNSVCPTFIETAMTAGMFEKPGFREWVESRIALGRVGKVEEIMGAVVFLASDASSLITGSAMMVDGGWTAA